MEAFDSYNPGQLRAVSFELGEQWFIADFPTDLLWGELDRFVAELRADGGSGYAAELGSFGKRPRAEGGPAEGYARRLSRRTVDRVPQAAGCSGGENVFCGDGRAGRQGVDRNFRR